MSQQEVEYPVMPLAHKDNVHSVKIRKQRLVPIDNLAIKGVDPMIAHAKMLPLEITDLIVGERPSRN